MSETESFTKSTCECTFCQETNQSLLNWEKYKKIPKKNLTSLQKNMLATIDRLEKKYSKTLSPKNPHS